jgi:hypothetical protein
VTIELPQGDGIDPGTRKLVYEHVKDAPELLIQDGNDLDNKGVGLLAAASVVLGLTSFGKLTGGGAPWEVVLTLGAAGVAFLYAAYHAGRLLGPATYVRSSHADDLWEAGKWYSPEDLTDYLIDSARVGYAANKKVVADKATHLKWLVRGLALEVVFVTVAVVLSAIY